MVLFLRIGFIAVGYWSIWRWGRGVMIGTAFDLFVDNDSDNDANSRLDNAVDNVELCAGNGAGKVGNDAEVDDAADGDGIFFVDDIADVNGNEHAKRDNE